MLNKNLLWIIVFVCLIMSASAEVYYKEDQNVSLNLPCVYNDGPCSNTAKCNISITDTLTGTYLANYQTTKNLLNGDFQYNTSFTTTGNYVVKLTCFDGGKNSTGLYSAIVTKSGVNESVDSAGYTTIILAILGMLIIFYLIGSNINASFVGQPGQDKKTQKKAVQVWINNIILKTLLLMIAYVGTFVPLGIVRNMAATMYPFNTGIISMLDTIIQVHIYTSFIVLIMTLIGIGIAVMMNLDIRKINKEMKDDED